MQNGMMWAASMGTWQRPEKLLFVIKKKATSSRGTVGPKTRPLTKDASKTD